MFQGAPFTLIGLHSVFEHHAAMTRVALEAFAHEYRLEFPIAIDEPGLDGPIPRTMAAWELQGTPSTLVWDKAGNLVLNQFGHLDDLALGANLGQWLAMPGPEAANSGLG
jgi:hypothetical protein